MAYLKGNLNLCVVLRKCSLNFSVDKWSKKTIKREENHLRDCLFIIAEIKRQFSYDFLYGPRFFPMRLSEHRESEIL